MSDFDGRWESFRVDREIPCETFVSSGHGFIEDMEEFFKIETKAIQKELEKEHQKVAMLKEALERVACLSQDKADETYYWDRNDRIDLAEIICDDIVMARKTLQKLKEMD